MTTETVNYVLEDDVFNDPRYESIFTRGIVVTRADDDSQNETLQNVIDPIELVERNVLPSASPAQVFSVARPTFREYVEAPQFKVFELVSKFNLEFPSRSSKAVEFGPLTINVPVIRSGQVAHANVCLTAYIHNIQEYLEISYFKDSDHYIDVDSTFRLVSDIVNAYVRSLTKPNPISRLFCQAVLLEQVALSTDYLILSHISTVRLVSDNAAMYQRQNVRDDTCTDRSTSMVQLSALRGTASIHYGLNRIQIDHLVTYIFSPNSCHRLESKIYLLSTTRDFVRSDLISRPGEVLLSTFSEYFMSPMDIASVLFCKPGSDSKRCPCCTGNISVINQIIDHSNCDLFMWVSEHLPVMVIGSTISTSPVRAVSAPISDRLRRLYSIKSKIQAHHIEHRHEGRRTLYTIHDNNMLSSQFSISSTYNPSVPIARHSH